MGEYYSCKLGQIEGSLGKGVLTIRCWSNPGDWVDFDVDVKNVRGPRVFEDYDWDLETDNRERRGGD